MTSTRMILIPLAALSLSAFDGRAHADIQGGWSCSTSAEADGTIGYSCTYDAGNNPTDGLNLDQPKPGFVLPAPGGSPPVFYRVYNWRTGDHLYSIDYNETNNALWDYGYGAYEGIIGRCWGYQASGTTPIYRMVSGSHHFYTSNWSEVLSAEGGGYAYEGVSCYAYPYQASGTCPLYRLLVGENHFYTTSWGEASKVLSMGYASYEGVTAYLNAYGSCPN